MADPTVDLLSPEKRVELKQYAVNGGVNAHKSLSSQQQSATKTSTRPALEPEALHGLAGKFIKTIEPYTEADPVAVLL